MAHSNGSTLTGTTQRDPLASEKLSEVHKCKPIYYGNTIEDRESAPRLVESVASGERFDTSVRDGFDRFFVEHLVYFGEPLEQGKRRTRR